MVDESALELHKSSTVNCDRWLIQYVRERSK